jgi:transcriptional regulator with XRE-family HTH domain
VRKLECDKCNGTGFIDVGVMTLGQKLRYFREQSGLSLREVGKIVDFSNASICQMEGDKIDNPSFHAVVKLAKCYDIDVNILINT